MCNARSVSMHESKPVSRRRRAQNLRSRSLRSVRRLSNSPWWLAILLAFVTSGSTAALVNALGGPWLAVTQGGFAPPKSNAT